MLFLYLLLFVYSWITATKKGEKMREKEMMIEKKRLRMVTEVECQRNGNQKKIIPSGI